MAKFIKTSILLFWFVMMGLLLYRTYLRPTTVIALGAITEEGVRTGEEWFGIYQQGRKIGYAHTNITLEGDAYHLVEESEMDILALERVQRIKTVMNSYAAKNFLLKYFDFSLRLRCKRRKSRRNRLLHRRLRNRALSHLRFQYRHAFNTQS